jgi:2-C-methyl-D-erythritol 2,4-cyclodiphosphate synthase
MAQEFRIGHGFDAHRLVRGRKLILGGVVVRHRKGLKGRSDADVLLHALMNALLGAMGEGDIGLHFPDSESRYEGIASTKLLGITVRMMRRRRFILINADVTVIAQEPKLAPYYAAMKKNIADVLHAPPHKINIKSATTEKLGWVGQGRGMAATAVVLLRRR